ncbi:MAG: sterol desaturase family protein [Myxococcota bacterium]
MEALLALLDALLDPFVDPGSRTFVPLLLGSLVVVGGLAMAGSRGARATLSAFATRSSRLDVQLLLARQLLRALGALPGLVSALWLASWVVALLDRLGTPEISLPSPVVTLLYSVVLFVVWDASRYAVHRLMHEIPALWAFHQVHHSAEALTPLTFHRVHPVESVLYQVRGALVTGLVAGVFFWLFRGSAQPAELFGVHAIGFVLNAVSGNLRHSHVWWSFGAAERWLVSPAQHQLHHGLGRDRSNYGTWLALWDRLGGSLELAESPPERFGIADDARNHGDDLVSAWLGPLADLASLSGRRTRPAREPESPAAPGSARAAPGGGSPATAAPRR